MRRLAASCFLFALATMLVGISTSAAHAYLDPGTGSMILQLMLGGVAGLALAAKLYWQKLLSMLGLKPEATEIRRDPN